MNHETVYLELSLSPSLSLSVYVCVCDLRQAGWDAWKDRQSSLWEHCRGLRTAAARPFQPLPHPAKKPLACTPDKGKQCVEKLSVCARAYVFMLHVLGQYHSLQRKIIPGRTEGLFTVSSSRSPLLLLLLLLHPRRLLGLLVSCAPG